MKTLKLIKQYKRLLEQQFGETEPRKVIETIERLIEFTDEGLEQELGDLDAH